jgi:hypothetical protein
MPGNLQMVKQYPSPNKFSPYIHSTKDPPAPGTAGIKSSRSPNLGVLQAAGQSSFAGGAAACSEDVDDHHVDLISPVSESSNTMDTIKSFMGKGLQNVSAS